MTGTAIQTGISSGAIPSETFGTNHLATKFVEIDRGDGSGTHPCYAAALTLNVAIPAGVTTQPTFYLSSGGSSSVPLTVSGSTATATIPWDTCAWTSKGLTLPADAVAALQQAGAAGLTLTLVPVGLDGATGTAVTTTVVIEQDASLTLKRTNTAVAKRLEHHAKKHRRAHA